MTKDEALDYIYKQQDIFSKYNLNSDITDVVIPLLNDIAKVVSKINDSDAVMDNYELGFIEGKAKGIEETIDKACKWLEDCLPNIEYITNASIYRQDKSKFIESFKKAMEE